MKSNTCYQHKVKMEHVKSDLTEFKMTKKEVEKLKLKDLNFQVIGKNDFHAIEDVKMFIEKYEWLGKINNYWNYAFALVYKEKIVSVIMIGTPSTFSKALGEKTKYLEQTLHRGASCSIAPKNAGSYLISRAIDWMVQNTRYRVFSGYSTMHEAFEFGYIYQSLNFILVNKNAGTKLEYLKPNTTNKWLSDRHLRKISTYKKMARELGINWEKEWNTGWKIHWEKLPHNLELKIRAELKEYIKTLTFRKVPPKLKYTLIKGKNRRETKELYKIFREYNPNLVNSDGSIGFPYPKKDRPCNIWASSKNEVENDSIKM